MSKTFEQTYNYFRYKIAEYDLGSFPGPKAGEQALDFSLYTPDGREVTLDDYRGKWLVLETGSITCSMYVKNIPGTRKLQEKYPDVEFLVIYVREAHPGSRLKPPVDDAEKRLLSQDMVKIYNEPRDVLIDSLEGDMHKSYGRLPNMVYVINPEGKVHYRCDWAFPKRIDRALQNRQEIDTNDHVVIFTAAPWVMIPVVLRGGWDALLDIMLVLPGLGWAHIVADVQNLKKKLGF